MCEENVSLFIESQLKIIISSNLWGIKVYVALNLLSVVVFYHIQHVIECVRSIVSVHYGGSV